MAIKSDAEFKDTLNDIRAVCEAGQYADRGWQQRKDTWDNILAKLAAATEYAIAQRDLNGRLVEDKNIQ